MDKFEQLRRLTGQVHKTGTRVLRADRFQTAAEQHLDDAQATLRQLHAELERSRDESERHRQRQREAEIARLRELAEADAEAAAKEAAAGKAASETDGDGPKPEAEPQPVLQLRSAARSRRKPMPRLVHVATLVLLGVVAASGVMAVVDRQNLKAAMQWTGAPHLLATIRDGVLAPAAPAATAARMQTGRGSAAGGPSDAGGARPERPGRISSTDMAVASGAIAAPSSASSPAVWSAASPVAAPMNDTGETALSPQPGSPQPASPQPASPQPASPQPGTAPSLPLVTGSTSPTAASANVAPYAARFAGIGAAERECLAQAVYYEARSEPVAGQIAVAQVILNRTMSPAWPQTVCGVVHQGEERGEKCQFSFACMHRGMATPHGDLWQQSSWVANEVLSGGAWLRELTDATHYHRTDVAPVWRLALKEIGRIGSHVFYGPPGSKSQLALEVAGDGGAAQRVPFAEAAANASHSIINSTAHRAHRTAPQSTHQNSAQQRGSRSVGDWKSRAIGAQ